MGRQIISGLSLLIDNIEAEQETYGTLTIMDRYNIEASKGFLRNPNVNPIVIEPPALSASFSPMDTSIQNLILESHYPEEITALFEARLMSSGLIYAIALNPKYTSLSIEGPSGSIGRVQLLFGGHKEFNDQQIELKDRSAKRFEFLRCNK